MSYEKSESRQFSRVSFRMAAELKVGDHEFNNVGIKDISMSGIFLESNFEIEKGGNCEINLKLEGVEPPIKIVLQGVIQRVEPDGVGVKFNQIPLESYEHLNHIVQFNSNNPSQSEDEIKKHVGLNPR